MANVNKIQMYFHCKKCIAERPSDQSPREWGRIECGWTAKGFQVWCHRHDLNIIHVDFEGMKHTTVQNEH